jgi:hypothetical protein
MLGKMPYRGGVREVAQDPQSGARRFEVFVVDANGQERGASMLSGHPTGTTDDLQRIVRVIESAVVRQIRIDSEDAGAALEGLSVSIGG